MSVIPVVNQCSFVLSFKKDNEKKEEDSTIKGFLFKHDFKLRTSF